ncbi:MAG: hypothetical protein JST00_34365 [Deltaproteobacteria bacterium]|nr:hypothetical protein [Deltaproteobacteria bacterium]
MAPFAGSRGRGWRGLLVGAPLCAVVLVGSSAGCTGKDPFNPGESLGTFRVTGALVSSTCGTTPNPWQFDVKLRHEAVTTLYWVQGGLPISGKLDPVARSVMSATETRNMRAADAKTSRAACNLVREDSLDVVLAPVTPPITDVKTATSFKGTLKYRFSPTQGSECDDQLLDTGGDFAALPCEVSYTIEGTKTAEK